MTEEIIIRHCSPTLAAIKAGSLFSYKFISKKDLLEDLRRLNIVLYKKGVSAIPLKISENRALIYVYRYSVLKKALNDKTACLILKRYGYNVENINQCIANLSKRVKQSECFPHEIGLFLGYPSEDVLGFIENKACNYKCCGLWKVYGDEAEAKKMFCKYKKCREVYLDQWQKGRSVERLTVAS